MTVIDQVKDPALVQCPVFGSCGGCQYQDLPYPQELALKQEQLRALITAQVVLKDACFQPAVPSPEVYHYRNRLDLKLTHRRNGDVHIGFSPIDRGPVIEITACPIAMKAISDFIPELRQLATLKIPKEYRMANLTVRCGEGEGVRWGGIGHNSLRLEARDYFYTDILGCRIYYGLDTFFQANLSILPALIDFIRSQDIWSKDAVFFDLYGGVGLFSLCVNDLVIKAVNIESNVHAARMAKYNISSNGMRNVEAHEGRVEDVLPGMLDKTSSDSNIIMVDPPRAGLSAEAVTLLNQLKRAKYLIYLSCDPASLASNLKDLIAGGWVVKTIRPFDFFPRTRHLETLIIFERT
ncbi:MAG: class I SAM-dependent RNA methyltransferase [Candidatus Omnitrophica bacterium]|nr:class I SAM-dependent RNA methyltransferase [Candidatus Omnitrophota bacterium]